MPYSHGVIDTTGRSVVLAIAAAVIAMAGFSASNGLQFGVEDTSITPNGHQHAAAEIKPTVWDFSKPSFPVDTSSIAIPKTTCLNYEGFRKHGISYRPYKPSVGHIQSIHELACRWAASEDISIDSTQLPRYVQIMSDTLHLSDDAFAYAVRLTPTENEPRRIENTIYFVANIADSLYYRDLGDEHRRQHHFNRTWIRSLRTLDVPRATSHYVWVETGNRSVYRTDTSKTTTRGWVGNILAYDTTRGIRYLSSAPIRAERTVNGDFKGMEQWDVAVPEPGIMTIGVRERKGEVVEDSPFFASPDWLGPHVIDPEAVSDSSEYRYLLEEPGILDR